MRTTVRAMVPSKLTGEDTLLVHSDAAFEADGRLLQELGERLVSSADVALVELIKNSYDADAATCWVSRTDDSIIIKDDGHGMAEKEFLYKWMRIATGNKQLDRKSRFFERKMTGAKGIGRFAVRFLGLELSLESVADDPERKSRTKLVAKFDWERIDQSAHLQQAKIPYDVFQVAPGTPTGVTLKISKLRDLKLNFGKALKTQVLGIVSPISGLDRGRFSIKAKKEDPGFSVLLPGDTDHTKDINLAATVLSHYYARVLIQHSSGSVTYTITHKDGRELFKETFSYASHISNGLQADIRFFPKRSKMFQGTEVDGWEAWGWVNSNSGVAVIDHGFRVKPYGLAENDWLFLDTDSTHNRRQWRSQLLTEHFPMAAPGEGISKEKANPMLYLPSSHQLIGAVFVESHHPDQSNRPTDLTSAINREGFIENEAYHDVVEIVRAGMELLALVDHRENRRLQEEKAKKEAEGFKSDLKTVVSYIRSIPSLTEEDRDRLTIEYSKLSKNLENVETYHQEARQRMDMMALLGVLSGFMTHEAKRLISDLDKVVRDLNLLARENESVEKFLPGIEKTLNEFRGQIEYSAIFIESIQDRSVKPSRIPVLPQIEFVVERFEQFAAGRHIYIEKDVEFDLLGPAVPVAMYSGILLNLFTNALKAVSTGTANNGDRKVIFKAWNDSKFHILEVADSGVGIPSNLRNRIWDPLFTTTSAGSSNPLGSGMGLGLSLVKEIMSRLKGKIELVDPPPGYSTCFKLQFPNT